MENELNPRSLVVRMSPFQGENAGSNPAVGKKN